jgi:Carboxypeptidase regulatory-like domain
MRSFRLQGVALVFALMLALGFTFGPLQQPVLSQETTGGMQGTVKDASGAVIPNATVTVTTPTLVGSKVTTTDAAGYYRFANLPPGKYTITVKGAGFETLKRENVMLEVGHLPTLDLSLKVGGVDTVVEVKTEGPMIDETTTTTLTNIPEETLQNIPHGTSFQSVIQFAPAARNEPLEGSSMLSNGSGSSSPGNGSNGGAFGFSIGGGADSENSYLVEGQETANIIGGYSHTNVPMDFIQEVQMKTSGVEAEYGGALGGVVNVIMDKGTNHWHGAVFTGFQNAAMNGSLNGYSRYDPSAGPCPAGTAGCPTTYTTDTPYNNFQPDRPKSSDFFPGVTVGGPLVGLLPKAIADHISDKWKDRVFLFAGFNPEFNAFEVKLNYGTPAQGGAGLGNVPFSQNTHTFYSYARVDAEVSEKVRVFASWLYQGQRQLGENLPGVGGELSSDSVNGLYNAITGCSGLGSSFTCVPNSFTSPTAFAHTLGYSAPNLTLNTGADITLTNSLVATSRFGYYFENYHDFGFPTSGAVDLFEDNGAATTDTTGASLTTSAPALAQATGYLNQALDGNYTHFNSNKAIQFDQDIAWFHAGGGGTHNLKFGYQLHRNSNYIFQGYNAPLIETWPGVSDPYSAQGTVGQTNCAAVEAQTGYGSCVGTYGTVNVNDFGSGGAAVGFNHGFYAQDAWTIGKGITLNYGVRIEREYLPAENQPSTEKITQPINFGWGDKIAPRIGAAWDVFRNGKMKIFGGYGQYFDQMKLNVAISSYGGQYWQECWYALMEPSLANILPAFNSSNRYCVGPSSSSEANWGSSATTPSGLIFLENQNLRAFPTTCPTCSTTQEGTAPNLKPYAQHDSAFGVDYQLSTNWAFEGRWDRRRLDHVIEDSAIFNPAVGETFVIVNPGQGVNNTFTNFYNFLYGAPPDCSLGCPPNKTIPAARSYDGIELRLTKNVSQHWMGMFSYTYSHLRGNYTGLTSSDVADGGGGRNAPNNSRSFDEPFFSWNSMGGSSSGLLPTDRPNAAKGYVYYDLPWLRRFATDFGVFQSAYSGSPLTSYLDAGFAFPGAFPTDIVDRGKWVDLTQDPNSGIITASNPYVKRTPAFLDTDFNFKQSYKLGESKNLSFDATFTNVLNQHSVTSFVQQMDSIAFTNYIAPNGETLFAGPAYYAAAMTPYNYVQAMNTAPTGVGGSGPFTVNSQYGHPYLYQVSRNIRLGLHLTF